MKESESRSKQPAKDERRGVGSSGAGVFVDRADRGAGGDGNIGIDDRAPDYSANPAGTIGERGCEFERSGSGNC